MKGDGVVMFVECGEGVRTSGAWGASVAVLCFLAYSEEEGTEFNGAGGIDVCLDS